MDIVDLDEMGLIDSTSEFIHGLVDTSMFCPDGTISISSEDLATFGNRVTYVTIPNLVQILQDGNTSNVSYIINNNQISDLNESSVVVYQDDPVEYTDPGPPLKGNCDDPLQTQLSDFLKSPANKSPLIVTPPDVDEALPKDVTLSPTSSVQCRVPIAIKQEVGPPDKTGNMICEKCNTQFRSWKPFKKHMWMHLHEKPFQCTFCHESFNYQLNLDLHSATHNAENPFCPVCKKSFNRIASLKAHIMLHEQEESLFCHDCGEEFASPIYLQRHMAEHRLEKNKQIFTRKVFRCKQCDQSFDTAANYKLHRIKYHMVLQNKKNRKLKRRSGGNSCEFCQKCFDKPSQLLRHKRIHTGERPYKCEICSRAFNQKGSLRIHMLKHTRERPYVCQFCHGTFSQKGNLQCHVRRLHMEPRGNEKVYKCKKCTCIFRKLGSLNAHFNKTHGNHKQQYSDKQKAHSSSDTSNKENENSKMESDGPGSTIDSHLVQESEGKARNELCFVCKKSFKRPRDLMRHIKTHVLGKPFKCNFCDKSFTLQSTLSMHIKTHIEGKKYTCLICKKSYSTIRNLKLHRKKHIMAGEESCDKNNPVDDGVPQGTLAVEPAPLVCLDQVDMSSLDATSNSNIILTENGNIVDVSNDIEEEEITDTSYRCFVCNMVFQKDAHLQIHLQSHNSNSYNCEHCPCTFNSRNTLNIHVRQHHLAVKHVCSVCRMQFTSESSLKRHEVVVHTHEEFPWACPLCGLTFKSYPSGKKHISIKHPKESKTTLPIRFVEEPNENGNNQTTETDPLHQKNAIPIVVMEESNDIQATLKSLLSVQANQLYIIANEDGESYIIPSKTITETGELEEYPVYQEGDLILNTPESNDSQKQVFENPLETCIFTFEEGTDVGNSIISATIPTIISQPQELDRCDMADLLISNVSDFSVDKSTPLLEKPHTCITCEKSFSSAIEYEEHLKLHKKPSTSSKNKSKSADFCNQQTALFSCAICNVKFMSFDDFTNHQDVHMNPEENVNSCDVCDAEFVTIQELEEHKNEHLPKEIVKCYLCCTEFSSQEKFKSHCLKCHNTQSSVPEKKKPRPNWRLPARRLTEEETKVLSTIEPDNASEKVLLQSLLEKHRFEHPVKEEPKPYIVHHHKCKYCPKSFRKPSDLIRHMRTHTGEKPFKCNACNKRFSIKSAASSHMKTHTKKKSYECYVCSKLFASTGSLKIHMRLHTGLKPFACHLCDAKFRTSGHKKAHLLTHLKTSQEESERREKNSDKNVVITSPSVSVTGTRESTFPSDNVETISGDLPCSDQGSQYLVPLKPESSDLSSQQIQKTDEFLMSFKLPNQEESDKGNQSSKTSKFLLNINDEGGGNGETPRYFLSIKDGGTGEDGFVLESISDDQIIVTITKGDSDIPKLPNQIEPGILQETVTMDCFTCSYCKKTYSKQSALDKHIKKLHLQELYQCTVCLEIFEQKSDLDVHCLTHDFDRELACSECGECFALDEELREHKCMKSVTLDLSMEHDLFLFLKGDYKLVQSPGSTQAGDG